MKHNHRQVISYPLTIPTEWYLTLQARNLGTIDKETFTFYSDIGLGQLRYQEFQKGFWAQQMDFTLKEPLPLIQTASKFNELFIINFYLSNASIRQYSGETLFEFNFDNISVMLSSSSAICHYNIPADEDVKIIQIGFTREWLLANAFDNDSSELKSLFTDDQPIYIAENLDYQFKYLVSEMDLASANRLFLFSSALHLLNTLFSKLEHRQLNQSHHSKIHHEDLEKLLEIRAAMDENPLEPISLDALAIQSEMSLTKFKRSFKQVFGVTPYQYHLKNKLAIAMDRLHQHYSVSEVAFLIGYTNLSHFAKSFKNQYGKLPSEVQKEA
ncbi:helix-turn-helix transcriptional regulator [Echinicola sp. CAU 1574]|uniref:Helix-turn-helix transcriptional regulator n=1 Tax=Echinicola arenosa TaxID=2774144 RepID=A0ABR9AI82_9BACT|nr:AraC family transcriptional regulator [Echinicola arenosa]MBD8488498.1 helix-turn-helix transcriptional regulator [Echinicola arenosa]